MIADSAFHRRAARKAKKAKKKGAAADDDDDGGGGGGGGRGPDVNQQWSFMSLGEVQELLEKNFRDIDAKVFEELAGILHRQLTKRFQEYVREAFQKGSDTAGMKADRSQNEAEYGRPRPTMGRGRPPAQAPRSPATILGNRIALPSCVL